MKILVTGVTGQLGYDIVKLGKSQNIDIVGIDRQDVDLIDEEAVKNYFAIHHDYDVIIHCAAYTAVDNAEDDIISATKINVDATSFLVDAAKKMDAKFIYISTDYVYSGEGNAPFTEEDNPQPESIYGKTKLAGEKIVEDYLKHYIVRISWVFGINGNNFIKTMLNLAATRDELTVVNDQFGSPTYTKDLAPLLLEMAKSNKYGIYNASNEGFCSWYDFSVKIFELAQKEINVLPVGSEDFPTKAKRPSNSRMDKTKLRVSGFEQLPKWEDATKRYLQELQESK